jgi:D-alanyl-D-alanine carboxypeptidase/D-alanyl-D-alanine-endopeptidase (penicillin-binding protein 4)
MNPSPRLTTALLVGLVIALTAAWARADLSTDVRTLLQDKSLARAEVGVEIVRLPEPGQTAGKAEILFKHNSDIPLIPASNLKLVTTSAALERLGPNFKFRTMLVRRGDDLVLIGDGDPTLGDAEMLRKVGWDVDTVFRNWATAFKNRGVMTVRDVVIDDSVFDQNFLHCNWPAEQQHKRYVAQVGGMQLNCNCIDFWLKTTAYGDVVRFVTDPPALGDFATIKNNCITGRENSVWLSREPGGNSIILRGQTNASSGEPVSVTVNDPPMYAASVLAETFKIEGVKITGTVRRDRTVRASLASADGSSSLVAVHETPLPAVLNRANKDSMNLYAESLCKRLGYEATKQPGSWENGTAAVKDFLIKSCGIDADEFSLDDGCGLSKQNQISSNALAQVLIHNFTGANRETFVASLAVGGQDGTLDHRFLDDLRGRVFAKSGFVNNVSCLSGYVKTRDDQWFAFSILMNGVTTGYAKQIQEKIVKAVDMQATKGIARN